ncbi:MAG: ABC transporter ATP-binding protein [Gemmatimonadetes bacterium]|nr:ABC transporter ATP-binding protein [Gemmatimonadota bacterium]
MSAILAQGLTRIYRRSAEEIAALFGADLIVEPGEFVAITGASGAGKTTLLNLLGCLDRPTSGLLKLLDRDVSTLRGKDLETMRRQHVGFVFQDYCLVPTLTVEENVALPLLFSRALHQRDRIRDLLAHVDLQHRSDHLPRELSGGEQQRVAIARALVNNPEILLADEPTGNLDSKRGNEIVTLLRNMNHTEGVTIVLSTHNLDLANRADRQIKLVDGRVV